MKKQNYEKPIASFIAFYSEKDINADMSGYGGATGEVGGVIGGSGLGEEIPEGIE